MENAFAQNAAPAAVPKWSAGEWSWTASKPYADYLTAAPLSVIFHGPDGEAQTVPGFWDGGATWKLRFSPDTVGE